MTTDKPDLFKVISHEQFGFIDGVFKEYLNIKKRGLADYKACSAYCNALNANSTDKARLFLKSTGYTGFFALNLIERHGLNLNNPCSIITDESIRNYARDVALLINIKNIERSGAGVVIVAYLTLDIYCHSSSQFFIDRLLEECKNLGPIALKNLLFSPWESYSARGNKISLAIGKSLQLKGNVVDVLTSMIGAENLSKCHKRLGLEELLPYATNETKRILIEQDLGL